GEGFVARARVDDADEDLRKLSETSRAGPCDHADLETREAAKRDPRRSEEAQLVEAIASVGQASPRNGAQPLSAAKRARDAAERGARARDRMGRQITKAPRAEDRKEERSVDEYEPTVVRRSARRRVRHAPPRGQEQREHDASHPRTRIEPSAPR